MKYSTSREKLSQMHQDLDRQLEMAGFPQRGKPKKERDDYRFVSEVNDNKKSTLSNISNKPPLYDYEVREVDIKSKKNQISDLEQKLMELERKMDNFEVSSGEEDESVSKRQRLHFNKKPQPKQNQDTARFLVNADEKERNHTKFTVEYPSLEDEEEDEEDSEDYFQIQQAVQKHKAEQKLINQRKQSEKETFRVRLDSRQKKQKYQLRQDTERKVMLQTQTALRPKYSNQRSRRSVKSNDKKSVGKQSNRDSVVSKKSVEKPKVLPRTNSRASIRSGDSIKKSNSKNLSREKMNRSIDRSQRGEQISKAEQVEVAKEMKRTNNLQRQLQHYKRLAQKYKQQLQDYKVMQIEFRELKKNFAKSEMIRGQQKKIIDSLKSKINK